MSTVRTPSPSVWRSSRRWRPGFQSWRETSGPIPELFDHGVEGRYWPLDDPVRAAAEVMDLLDSEPERLQAARSATERFQRDFDADNVASRLFQFVMGITPSSLRDQATTKPRSL